MPRTCTICTHSDHASIDSAIVAGNDSNRLIASQFGVNEASIRRHAESHIPAQLVKAHEANEVTQADDLLSEVKRLQDHADRLLGKAETGGDYRTAISAIREARGCLELLAKLRGQLDDRPQVNVLILPEWQQIRVTLMRALEGHPDARVAVAQALRSIDAPR